MGHKSEKSLPLPPTKKRYVPPDLMTGVGDGYGYVDWGVYSLLKYLQLRVSAIFLLHFKLFIKQIFLSILRYILVQSQCRRIPQQFKTSTSY